MALALFRTILTLVVAVFLVCIIGANDFANPDASLVRNDECDESVKPLRFWGSELCFTHGVTAALFALAAAALLFISLIPGGDRTADGLSEALHRLVSSVAATGAGVYWLKDEAGETAWLHLAVVLFLGGIVIGSAAVPVAVFFAAQLSSSLGYSTDPCTASHEVIGEETYKDAWGVQAQIGASWDVSITFVAFRGGGFDGYLDLGEHNPRVIALGEVLTELDTWSSWLPCWIPLVFEMAGKAPVSLRGCAATPC